MARWDALRRGGEIRHTRCVELPIDRADVQAIVIGLFDANWKLDKILSYIEGEDDEEEDEADSP